MPGISVELSQAATVDSRHRLNLRTFSIGYNQVTRHLAGTSAEPLR